MVFKINNVGSNPAYPVVLFFFILNIHMQNLRNKLKILIKISTDDSKVEVSKISSIISQYGVEDSGLLDNYIEKELNLPLIATDELKFKFFFSFNILIFRNDFDTLLILQKFQLGSLIKFLLDLKKVKYINNTYNCFLLFNLSFLNLDYINFLNLKKNFYGTIRTYKFREKMKARKINFRRKLRKNMFNED